MNFKVIEESAFEKLVEQLNTIREKLDQLEARQLESRWLSGEEVMKILRISKRTLQSYRDKHIIGFSQFGTKIYYKAADIFAHLKSNYMPALGRNKRRR